MESIMLEIRDLNEFNPLKFIKTINTTVITKHIDIMCQKTTGRDRGDSQLFTFT